jgi:hypothetical protein
MWKLIDSKGRTCMVHADKALVEFWARHEWKMCNYKIVKV